MKVNGYLKELSNNLSNNFAKAISSILHWYEIDGNNKECLEVENAILFLKMSPLIMNLIPCALINWFQVNNKLIDKISVNWLSPIWILSL